jgi:hypothetical protein
LLLLGASGALAQAITPPPTTAPASATAPVDAKAPQLPNADAAPSAGAPAPTLAGIDQPAAPAAPAPVLTPAVSQAPAVQTAADVSSAPAADGAQSQKARHDSKGESEILYEPGKGLSIRSGKVRLRMFFAVESVLKYGHCDGDNCAPTDSVDWHVRRARIGFSLKLPHKLHLDVGFQIKNEDLVLQAAYFSWRTDDVDIASGYFKPPGGLERDASTWIKPFPERSVLSNLKEQDGPAELHCYSPAKMHATRPGAARPRYG